jgi:predicted ABC-type ATPase
MVDFGFETVFSHESNVQFLSALKLLGYFVQLNFVCTEHPLINVGRVRNRVSLGGHDVPEDKIISRYTRALDLLSDSIGSFDKIVFMDNSSANTAGRVIGETTKTENETRLEILGACPSWVARALHPNFVPRLGMKTTPEESYYSENAKHREELLAEFLIEIPN